MTVVMCRIMNEITIRTTVAVLVCLTILIPSVCESSSRVSKAVVEIEFLEKALYNFEQDVKRLPTNEDGLEAITAPKKPILGWHGPYLKKSLPRDPWGHDYKYIMPSMYGNKKFDLYSVGADGIDDHGNGDDISNWKEYDKKYYKDTTVWRDRLFILFQFFVLFLIIIYIIKKRHGKQSEKTT